MILKFHKQTAIILSKKPLYCLGFLFLLGSCESEKKVENNVVLLENNPTTTLNFSAVDKKHSKISFANQISEIPALNYFNFPYMYNGAGVAVGDINNDGLQDIYFIGNMTSNALYLNKGNLQFEDITKKSNTSGQDNLRWSNGVTMADVNNDGWLDIYVSASGPFKTRKNLLYINNKDLTFTEMSKEYGLDDNGYSTQSVFFDYDRDGDLDLYLCAYAPTALEATNEYFVKKHKNPLDEEMDKLYRNDGNDHFTDVTKEAGVINFGLSLSASVADYNGDGWMDIYVSNDFNSPDFLYINNGDGTFTDEIGKAMNHIANFGMGSDAADINNDGFIDLIQLDMGGDNNKDRKTNMSAMSPELFYDAVDKGLHYQYMKNNLQLNNGDGTYSEIAELAGVTNTSWSWSVLICDLNNDSWKDIFIGNGMRRNVNDNDFNNYDKLLQAQGKINKNNRHLLIDKMPVKAEDNYAFVNQGDLTFKHQKGNWGLSHVGFTQGAAYADLDNDGDLDIVLNNLDQYASVFKNNAIDSFPQNHYLRIKLKGVEDNQFGIGSKVKLISNGKVQYQELNPTRGYLSSVEPLIHFGLGKTVLIDTLEVMWPNGQLQFLYNVKGDQTVNIVQEKRNKKLLFKKIETDNLRTYFDDITNSTKINFVHKENVFDDYIRETLLPHKMSQHGPGLSVGDVDGDGLEDFYIGGAKGYKGQVYIQQSDATFIKQVSKQFSNDKKYEDISSLLFDVDKDGDLDLYVVSGGNENPVNSSYYEDRLYLNDGKGNFERNLMALPKIFESGSKVRAADYDNDGDLDLFIGGRQIPGKYPFPASSYLLENVSDDENVKFINVSDDKAPMLKRIGMVTDAKWLDLDNDGNKDIVIVGEWMPITLLRNNGNGFDDVTIEYGLEDQTGWWNTVSVADLDNDGDEDFIAGNLGLNYKYKASKEEPFEVFCDDFDNNGVYDIILGYHEDGNLFPMRGRSCTSNQMPFVKKKFPTYRAFSDATLIDVLEEKGMKNALHYKVNTFSTTYFKNEGSTFSILPLEVSAQLSSVNAIYFSDFDSDGYKDVVLAGNLYESEVETPRSDASFGVYLKNDAGTNFETVPTIKSGLSIRGETRDLVEIKLATGVKVIMAVRNEDGIVIYKNLE